MAENYKYLGEAGLAKLIDLVYTEIKGIEIPDIDKDTLDKIKELLGDAEGFATAESVEKLKKEINDKLGSTDISDLGATITAAIAALKSKVDSVGDLEDWGGDEETETVVDALEELLDKIETINELLESSTPLTTEDKTVTGAINELKTAVDDKASSDDLTNLKKTALKQVTFGAIEDKTIKLDLAWNEEGGQGLTKQITLDLSDMFDEYETSDRFLESVAPSEDGTKLIFTFNIVKQGESGTTKTIEVNLSDILKGLKGGNTDDIEVSVSANTVTAKLTSEVSDKIDKIEDIESDLEEVSGKVDSLEETIGDAADGLVKDIEDLKDVVGDEEEGLVADVEDLKDRVKDIEDNAPTFEEIDAAAVTTAWNAKFNPED